MSVTATDLPVLAERLARENAVLKADVDRLTAVATGLETECNNVRARAVDAEARNRSLQRQVAALESESEVMRSEIASKHSRWVGGCVTASRGCGACTP